MEEKHWTRFQSKTSVFTEFLRRNVDWAQDGDVAYDLSLLAEFEGESKEEDFVFQIICRLKHVSLPVSVLACRGVYS